MEDDDLTGRFEITNVLGASGTVAMQRLANAKGADDLVMTMGLGVVGAVYTNESDARVSDMTPIARLVEEQEGLLVPADSPFETVDDLVRGLEGRPRLGHRRRRLDRRRPRPPVPDAARRGGRHRPARGQLHRPTTAAARSPAALLGSKIDVGTSGLGEFEGQIEDGSLRVLAVSGAERLDERRRPDADRGGHRPGLHQLARRARPARASPTEHARTTSSTCSPRCTTPTRGARQLEAQRLDRQLRHRRGVRHVPRRAGRPRRRHPEGAGAGMSHRLALDEHRGRRTSRPRRPSRLVDKAQYGLAAFLVVVGAYVLYDASHPARRASPTSRCSPTPSRYVVGAALRGARRPARRRHRARRPCPRPRRARTSTSTAAPTGAPSRMLVGVFVAQHRS